MAAEKEKVGAEFQALRAFLVEQEGRLLGRLEVLSREVTQKQNENLAQLESEITQLSKLSSQIQETAQKPDIDFLQEFKNTLSKCSSVPCSKPTTVSSEMKNKVWNVSLKSFVLKGLLKKFKEDLQEELEKEEKGMDDHWAVSIRLASSDLHIDFPNRLVNCATCCQSELQLLS
ncbi:zinc finger protein RFP-like protein [Cricetulus griseus]|nr:zinc finger protein RFP-like protein [Cricetulus griseus]